MRTSEKGVPGAVPGASTDLTTDSTTGIPSTTEQCSVEIAKALPETLEPEIKANLSRTFGKNGVRGLQAVADPAGESEMGNCQGYELGCICQACMDKTRKCVRKGCAKERVRGGAFCLGHSLCSASVSCDETEGSRASVFELAWEVLAEDSNLDPVTVAACKLLRDREVSR